MAAEKAEAGKAEAGKAEAGKGDGVKAEAGKGDGVKAEAEKTRRSRRTQVAEKEKQHPGRCRNNPPVVTAVPKPSKKIMRDASRGGAADRRGAARRGAYALLRPEEEAATESAREAAKGENEEGKGDAEKECHLFLPGFAFFAAISAAT
ncbi:unnamed protein product [Closterium sp. Naga37s-1]|nr:unnamed protein product [Closterium sp. Naga37s-1]